ncbi:MAG: hypothetical protein ACI4P5_04640, partial [Candidatus Fimadaptatus sp.]
MKKMLSVLLVLMMLVAVIPAAALADAADAPIEIKVLILPKFEAGEMSGDFPGEAQYYYEG